MLQVQSVMLLITSVALIYMSSITTNDEFWQSQAIERGYAIYCPSNGSFAWKEECS